MRKNINILHLEDSPADSYLVKEAIKKGEFDFEYFAVDNEKDFHSTLEQQNIDIVLSDYNLPNYSGSVALKLILSKYPQIPLVFVSGTMGEHAAIESLLNGATDYVLKDKLERLVPAINRAIREAKLKQEYQEAVESVRQREELYRILVEGMNEGLMRVDNDDIILFVNRQICEITGYSAEEMVGKVGNELLYREENRSVIKQQNLSRLQGAKDRYEIQLLRKDNTDIWVRISGSPVYDKKGYVVGSIGVIENINERKMAEEALRESQQLFQTLAQISPVGIFRTLSDGYTTYVNPKWSELSGLTFNEALGDGWLKAVHPADREILTRNWYADINSEKTSNAEYRFLKPDGSIVWVIGNAVPEWDQDEIIGYVGTITDITERKLIEEALHDSEERFKALYDDAVVGLYRTTYNGKILLANKALIKMLGYSSFEDLSIKEVERDGFGPTYSRQMFIDKIEKDGEIRDLEAKWICHDGREIFIRESARAIHDISGKTVYYDGTLEDITDRKKIEQDLILAKEKAEASDRLKTAFMNNISHEVRTPLNGILGFSELLAQQDVTYEQKKHFQSLIHLSSMRLLNTINSYMDISLIASGNMVIYRKNTELHPLLHKLHERFIPACADKNISLSLRIPDRGKDLTINTDGELLKKVLTHLLDNALKFTTEGEVIFGYTVKTGYLEFFVEDPGSGISKEALSRIFDTFVQEDVSITRGYEGSGLGLSISKGIVHLLGGEISVESEKGYGSVFRFTIPHQESSIAGQEIAELRPVAVPDERPVILIAEDDDSNLLFMELILQNRDVSLLYATNGIEAVEQCRSHPEISLVLMDVKMPVMDGLEATQKIKSFRKDLMIIAVTAYAMSGDEKKLLDAGCDDYLAKPLKKEILLGKLKHYGLIS
ncbi:MAG: PAS domain S-box protein [Bacteroidetes bacterium]|nr:PAS domain S-box protein [Bacteroidota bacterium]